MIQGEGDAGVTKLGHDAQSVREAVMREAVGVVAEMHVMNCRCFAFCRTGAACLA